MMHKSSIDENLDMVLFHTMLAEAHRVETSEGRTQECDKDEWEAIIETGKAYFMDEAERQEHVHSYNQLQNIEDEGMKATLQGNKTLAGNRANMQFYRSVSLSNLVNLLLSKEEVGMIDDLLQKGAEYAFEHRLDMPVTELDVRRIIPRASGA